MSSAYQDKIAEGFKFRDYFWLRLGRIYPLHLFFLLIWGIYVFIKWNLFNYQIELTNPLIKNTFASFISNLLLVHSLNFHNYTSWNYPSWSISVEFFTYFFFFAFSVLIGKRNRWIIAFAAFFISIATYFYVFNGSNWTTMDFTVTTGIYRCCGGFFAGVFLFQATRKLRNLSGYLTNTLEIISVGLVILTVSYSGANKAILFSVVPVFIFVVFAFSQENDGIFGKFLQLKPFAEAGKYSYSIYLSHAIVLDIAFSLAQYLFVKPTEVIYFYQSDYSYFINFGLVLLVLGISKVTYLTIEKTWIDKSKRLVVKFNEFDEIQIKKASVFSLD